MGLLAAFIVGVLLGWLVAWFLQKRLDENLIDEVAKLQRQLTECQREKEELQSSRAAAPPAAAEAAAATRTAPMEIPATEQVDSAAEVETEAPEERPDAVQPDTGEEAASAEEELPATRAAVVDLGSEPTPEAPAPAPGTASADLTAIKGIGPKFAEALAAAGITSYADLANTPVEQLQEIVQPAAWQKVDFDEWVAQASTLSRQSRRMQIGDDLTRLEGIGPTYAQKLRAADITTFAQLAGADEETLGRIIDAPAWRRVDYPSWIAQAKLAAAGDDAGLQAMQDELNRRQGDNLGLIQGIGATTLTALNDAGINTYAQLAEATPEQLSDVLSSAGVRRGNFESWIEEAKQRAAGRRISRGPARTRAIPEGASVSACPQNLDSIEGIGETYEQRLYNVGIGTFWEVSMLPQDDLKEILDVQAFQDVDLDAMQESARALAQETNTVGRVWDGSEPDDFETLPGIGEVFEQRLYDAGICTYAALAQLTEDRLQEICQAHPNFAPNFTLWLERAREAVG